MEKLLTKKEIMDIAKISSSTFDRLKRNDNDFPKPIKFGNAYRYKPSDVEKYFNLKKGVDNV